MPSGARFGRAAIFLATCSLVSACGSTASSHRSTLQQKIGTPGGISATELRLRLYELPQRLGGIVEVAADRIRLRYEGRYYEFDRDRCKIIFQENPDRWLDAFGEVLDQPR